MPVIDSFNVPFVMLCLCLSVSIAWLLMWQGFTKFSWNDRIFCRGRGDNDWFLFLWNLFEFYLFQHSRGDSTTAKGRGMEWALALTAFRPSASVGKRIAARAQGCIGGYARQCIGNDHTLYMYT